MMGAPDPQATSAPLPAELGEVIGGYRLDAVISQGGMGCVYRAVHARLGRGAAVKVLSSQFAADQIYVARFFREAKIVNAVRHANIIDIFDFLETESPHRVACIMEYLEGPTLKDAIALGRFTLAQALNVSLQLVSALQAVHALGVIHRDLKPTNIIVVGDPRGDLSLVPCVKVLDFGIAKVENAAEHHTVSGTMLGTPAYMAPEQVVADAVSAATDIYALGELLYEMLSGRRAYLGKRTQVLRAKVVGELPDLPLPAGLGPARELHTLISRCLEQKPAARPTLRELQDTLLALRDQQDEDQGLDLLGAPTLRPEDRAAPVVTQLVRPPPSRPLSEDGVEISLDRGATETTTPSVEPRALAPAAALPRRRRWAWAVALGLVAGAGVALASLQSPSTTAAGEAAAPTPRPPPSSSAPARQALSPAPVSTSSVVPRAPIAPTVRSDSPPPLEQAPAEVGPETVGAASSRGEVTSARARPAATAARTRVRSPAPAAMLRKDDPPVPAADEQARPAPAPPSTRPKDDVPPW